MKTILIVEPSASMRQMISHTLKTDGFAVIEAGSGQDALFVSLLPPSVDMVLMEVNLPNTEDGLKLIKMLREENPRFKSTPILVLSTETSETVRRAGLSAGATGWLYKPFDPAKLLEIVHKVIR